MNRDRAVKWTLVLSVIAAVLALAAAVGAYLRSGEVRWSLIAAGIFLLAFGFGAKNRMQPGA